MSSLSTEHSPWQDQLSHVYWIGGPPDAGKSTIADLLGEWFNVKVYKQDRHEMEHIRRADPARYPLNAALYRQVEEATPDRPFHQMWVDHTPRELMHSARGIWSERIGLIREDLAAMDSHRPIVAEGPGFFPDVIRPLVPDLHHAIWLVTTETFKRASHLRRNKSAWRLETSNPDLALANHIERDLMIAAAYRQDITAANLPWIEIDGTEDAEAVARRVADHFGFGQPDAVNHQARHTPTT